MIRKGKGKIIKDAVHGDIFIEKKFFDLIETKEFQRLRRINQLSVANLIFPSAEHTRFSHSIGTFHIMKKIIEHFKEEFNFINISINEREENLALAVALLHDIGHGPFSHSFERILNRSHEQWTKEIILNTEGNINRVLKENFDENFPMDLVELISKRYLVRSKNIWKSNKKDINLFFIISSLISSQLDADRLDYLVRDSFSTGVKFGNIDLSRIITSMSLTEYKDDIYICIAEKNVPDIEEYLIARYQMYQSVYYHDNKCEMENVIEKIFRRIEELMDKGVFNYPLPREILSIFNKDKFSLDEYIDLDDSTLFYVFKVLRNGEDFILKTLCNVILNREKFKRLQIMDNSKTYVDNFKEDFKIILKKYNLKIDDLKNQYFWIEENVRTVIYNTQKENIWVLRNNGTLQDISTFSPVTSFKRSKDIYFFNIDILLSLIQQERDKCSMKVELEELINKYNGEG